MIDAPIPRPSKGRPDEPRPADSPPTDARRRRRVRVPDAAPIGQDDFGAAKREERARLSSEREERAPAIAQTAPVHEEPVTWPAIDGDVVAVERGLRSIVGGGSSQVTPGAALRARDAARPRPADLDRAETDLTIIRRHWSPRD